MGSQASTQQRSQGRGWLIGGIALGLLTLVALAFYIHAQNRRASEARASVERTLAVLRLTLQLEAVSSLMEASHRGYLLDGSERFLQQRNRAYMQGVDTVRQLVGAVADDPVQWRRADVVQQQLQQRYGYMRRASGEAARSGLPAARVLFRPQGPGSFDPLMAELSQLRTSSERRLQALVQRANDDARAFDRVLAVGAAAAMALLSLAGFLLLQQLRQGDRLHRQLQQSLAVQQAILDSAGYMIVATDPAGRIGLFNRAASLALGYNADELIGREEPLLFHDRDEVLARADSVGADEPSFVSTVVAMARDSGEEVPWTYVARDGRRFPVLLTVNAMRAPDGKLLGYVNMARDVTERRLAEQRLRDSEERMRTVLDTAHDAFIAIDRNGRIVDWNTQAEVTFGWPTEDIVGRGLAETVIPPRYREAHQAGLRHYLATGEGPALNRRIEIVALHRDGHEFPIEISIRPTRTGDDVMFHAFLRDISERKAGERNILALNAELAGKAAELEQSNRELEAFSYTISHDLRAPLRHVDGYARMLREDAGELEPELQRYVHAIGDGARQMGALIDDLLAFSRLGRKALDRTQVDMTDLAWRAMREAGGDDSAADIVIAPLPGAYADPVLLRQVWVNLLSNALKYSAPRGGDARIEVSGERDDNVLRYRVRDNGVGFDMRYADKLFGVFQRLHSQEEFEGTGVGLAIVRRIVTRHGGSIIAEAEPDRGATFTLELPAEGATV